MDTASELEAEARDAPDIIVDTNAAETPLYEALKAQLGTSVRIVRQRLDVGDVELRSTTGPLDVLVVERKKWSDMAASIQDGRYNDQKERFLGSRDSLEVDEGKTTQMMYLIESSSVPSFVGCTRGMSNKAIFAAILKTSVRDGLLVQYAADTQSAASMLKYMYTELVGGGMLPASRKGVAAGVSRKRKRENVATPEAQWRAMLSLVDGMSQSKAESVAKVYPTLKSIVNATAKDLADVPCGARRLGPALGKKLQALCG